MTAIGSTTLQDLSHPVPTVGTVAAAPSLPVPPGLVSCRAVLGYDDAGIETLQRKHTAEYADLHTR